MAGDILTEEQLALETCIEDAETQEELDLFYVFKEDKFGTNYLDQYYGE